MHRAAIIGAGELGGQLAFDLAANDRFTEVQLIDDATAIAAGKSLDIQQSGAITRSGTRVTGTSEVASAAGADVIVLADRAGAPAGEWQGDAGLDVLRELVRIDARAVLVCAGAEQRALIALATSELQVPPARIVGSAPGALAAAVRALVALAADCSPAEVSLAMAGLPPHGTVIAWSGATIRGYPVSAVLSADRLAHIRRRVRRLWPPGPYALAAAATQAITAVLPHGHRAASTCFVRLTGAGTPRGTVLATLCRLGPRGVEETHEPVLSPVEQVQLDNALARAGDR